MEADPKAMREALEAALAENPDDLASHSAYADLLMEQGDPRAEFIQVQLALEDPSCKGKRRSELEQREQVLLEKEREWLGDFAAHLFGKEVDPYREAHGIENAWYWSRGWLDEITFWNMEMADAEALVRAPLARLLRRLGIAEGRLTPLLDAPFLRHLRYFRFGAEVDYELGRYDCTAVAENLVPLVSRMTSLEELYLLAHRLELRELFALPTLGRLRTLVVYHERDENYPLDALAANPAFSSLQTLRMHPGHSFDTDGFLQLEEVAALFHSPHLGKLRHLHLHASTMGDEGCEELVESGMLERLETLDLRFGRITDAGVNILLDSPHIHNLQYLSLDDNQIGDEGVELLRNLDLPVVRCDNQHEEGDDEYLTSGDWE